MPYPNKKQRWLVYMLECGDGTLYTGISNNVAARIEAHRLGRGAKYTRGRQPLKLVCTIASRNKSAALKKEYAIKGLSKDQKLALIKKYNNLG
jgi:putative endonuclease